MARKYFDIIWKKGRLVRSIIIIIISFLFASSWGLTRVYAQGPTCSAAEPFCTGTVATFPAGVNSGNAPFGNNYGCLFTRPNPAWYYMEIDDPGFLSISLSNSNNVDIDFILYGPFPNLAAALSSCGSLGTGGPNGTNVIQSCSYSPSPNETATINNAQTGEVYILLITNFSNNPTNITFTDNPSSTATTNCDILDCEIELSGSSLPATCGNENGSVSIQISGGSGSYGINWSNGTSGATTINNLAPGTYTVTVTDIDDPDCTNETSFTVNDEGNLELGAEFTPTTCGEDNGTATILITDGQGPYTFQWPSPITGDVDFQENLPPGSYIVTVTDQSNGCEETIQIVIDPSEDLSVLETVNATTCNQNNGSIEIEVNNGSGNYSFEWSDENLLGSEVMNLDPGNYAVTITDLNTGCTLEREYIIGTSPPLEIAVDSSSTTCGQANGFISLTVVQGIGPFSVNWFGEAPDNALEANNLEAGLYTIEITDEGGNCSEILEIEILPSEPLIIDVTVTPTSCGEENGAIFIDVSNGSGNYTFAWLDFGGYVAPSIENLPAGTYTVIVRDEVQLCNEELEITIDPSEDLDVDLDITPTTCSQDNGTIQITLLNGSGIFSYEWSTAGIEGESITDLSPGTYTVTITDDVLGCEAEREIVINDSEELVFDIQIIPTTCGLDNGTIELNALNGSGNFEYEWDLANSNSATASNLVGGITYTVVVTDLEDNCIFETSQFIAASDKLELSIQTQPLVCGPNDASAEISVLNGSGDFTYEWDNFPNLNSPLLSGISAGMFAFTIMDNQTGCELDSFVTILPITPFTIDCEVLMDESIFGENDGSAQISISEGAAPFTITIDDGTTITEEETSERIFLLENLAPGNINFSIVDDNGCSDFCTITIEAGPCALEAIVEEIVHPSCFGFSDGMISLSTNSPQNVIYQWASPLQNEDTSVVSNLTAGIYSVTIIDYLGCEVILNPELTEPAVIDLACTISQQETSKGANDGIIMTTFSGGTTPYEIILIQDDTQVQSSSEQSASTIEFEELAPGAYMVVITDSNGCEESCTIEIEEGPCILAVEATVDHVSCFDGADGAILLEISGNKGSVDIDWPSFNMEALISDTMASSISAGAYTIFVQDEENCIDSVEVILNEPEPISLTCSAIHETEALAGDGFVLLDINSYQAPITAMINSMPSQTITADTPGEIIFQNLIPGIYQIQITDGNGCTASCQTIINPADCELELELLNADNLTCFESQNGSIEVFANGGTGQIDYFWTGAINTSGESFYDSLSAGNYIIQAIDVRGCSDELRVQLTQPDKIAITSQTQNPTCNEPNGSIEINITGGTPEYSLAWSDGNTEEKFRNGLDEGLYSVSVTDRNACLESMDFNLDMEESPIIADSLIQNVSCFGGGDGQLSIEVNGGIPEYTYEWSTGDLEVSTIENLTAGAYAVTVTDLNACIVTQRFVITQPDQLTAEVFITEPDCGINNGSIELQLAGGVGDYVITGDLEGIETIYEDLLPGTYDIIIYDANQCQTEVSFEIVFRELPKSDAGADQTLSCRDPVVELTSPLNFIPGYTYQWYEVSTGELLMENIQSITTDFAGNYELRVYHPDNGCIGRDTVTVFNDINDIVFVETSSSNPLCFGSDDGIISIGEIQGGTPPFQFIFNGEVRTEQIFTRLEPATYTIDIIDAGGCKWPTITYTLEEPNLLELQLQESYFAERGDIVLLQPIISDSSRAEHITWSNELGVICQECETIALTIEAMKNTTFEIAVEDKNGCQVVGQTRLFVRQSRNIFIPSAFSPNSDGANDRFFIYGDDQLSSIRSFEIFDRWGSKLYHEVNLDPNNELRGWDGTFRGRAMLPGSYVYTIEVEYTDGETDIFYGEVVIMN